MRVSAAALLSCLWLSACGRTPASASAPPGPPQEAALPVPAVAVPQPEASLELRLPFDSTNGPAWAELLRMERWADAAALLDADPALVARPELRYARAAAAERLGQPKRVVELLAGLEKDLPLLATTIRERRARAALVAGDPRETLAVFRGKTDAESRLLTARAVEAVEGPERARGLLEALLRKLPRRKSPCSLEAPIRAELARLLEPRSAPLARREYRWLAVQAPLCPSAEPALDKLEQLSAPALDRDERRARAQAFADAGAVELAESELPALLRAKGPPLQPGMVSYFQGWARYVGRVELERAVEALSSAARANREQAPAWLFYAGRAASRLGDAERARSLFERVRREHPQSSFAEAGQYQAAQIHYEHGRFAEAARGFDQYLTRHGRRGRFGDEAYDERAVAWLASGSAAAAARAFDELRRPASGLERARYDELYAVALVKSGRRDEGVAALRAVMRDYPLTFAALAAEARLRTLDETPAPLVPGTAAPAAGPLIPAVPNVARLLHALGLDAEAEKELAGAEASVSRAHPGRGDEALCRAYAELAPKARAYRVGVRAATRAELMAPPVPGREWLWDCVYPRPYTALISEIAGAVSVEPELVYAIIRQESAFRPDAVSPATAVGLMQLMPATARRVATEFALPHEPDRLTEPPVNIGYGTRYLRKLLDLFDGNVALAAASYNAGPTAVLRWLAGSPELELDLFVARIPYAETRAYVERVVGNYARYHYLGAGSQNVALALGLPAPKSVDPSVLY